jgi:hypothetical protein
LVVLTGCYIRSVDPIDADDVTRVYKQFKKVSEDKVKVYAAVKFAPKNCVLLARLRTNEECKSLDLMIKAMQKKAASLHANAIVFEAVTPRTNGYPFVEDETAKPLDKVVARTTSVPVTQKIVGENSVAVGTQYKKEDGETIGNTYDPMTNSKHYYSFKSDGTPRKNEGYRGYAWAVYVEEK